MFGQTVNHTASLSVSDWFAIIGTTLTSLVAISVLIGLLVRPISRHLSQLDGKLGQLSATEQRTESLLESHASELQRHYVDAARTEKAVDDIRTVLRDVVARVAVLEATMPRRGEG
jgi:hypothetical protein